VVIPEELLVHPGPGGLRGYSRSGLDLLVHRIEQKVRALGFPVQLSSHMFRRSGATLLEEALLASPEASKDGVFRVVQGFLRHESLATTMRYLEANPARQERALERYAQALPWGKRSEGTRCPPEGP
jgi:integrase